MELKAFPFEVKMDADNQFEGYFSIKGNIDDGGDRMMPGCFAKTFMENLKRIKGLYMHDFYKPFSKPLELFEDTRGAYVKGTISLTSWGQDLKTLMCDGVVDEMSFGYDAVKYDYEDINGKRVRNLREVKCWEYSPVTWGMNSATSINGVKQLSQIFDYTKQGELSPSLLINLILNSQLKDAVDLTEELKAGRMISQANMEKIHAAIEALQALLAAAEPPKGTPLDDKSLGNKDDDNPDLQLLLQEIRAMKGSEPK